MERAIALARALDKAKLENVTRVVIDTKMGTVSNDPKWGYLLTPDMNKVRAAADAIFADAPSGLSAAEAQRQTIQAEAARIVVLNGTQEKGLASKTQANLITAGFNVITVGNADSDAFPSTVIITYGDKGPATVEALARWFAVSPDSIRSEPPSDQADITVIVGTDQATPAQ